MKKLSLLIALVLGTFLISEAQIKKAAIISIYGNKNLTDDPLETKMYQALLNDSSYSITHTIEEFETTLNEVVIPKFPFPFASKEEITGNEKYQAIKERQLSSVTSEEDSGYVAYFSNLVTASGYKAISGYGSIAKDTRIIKEVFEMFPDIDAVMTAYIDFNLVTEAGAMGLSSKKVGAYCHIAVYDRELNKLMRLRESAKSNESVMGAMGMVTDPEKLKPMVKSASENLIKDLHGGKINKKIDKMVKKMNK